MFSQKKLEKAPLLVPLQHIPSDDGPENFLDFEERVILSLAMQKLAKVADIAYNLIEPFKDFDPENCGTITRCQLIKVLTLRELHTLVSSREINLVFKAFSSNQRFKYREFLNALDIVASAQANKPF